MNGILLVPQQCCNEIWISISPLSAWNFRGSRYLMQGPIIASHSIPWDARWLRHAWDTCFWWQSFYLVLFVCYSLECFSINHHIFLWESGDRADTSLTLILSYRHGNAHYNKKLQLRRSHDRSKFITLRWRHNDHAGVSNHQPHGCLLNRLFRRKSKKTSKLRVTGLCAGNSPGTGEFPAQMASYAENVSIWWRHHDGNPQGSIHVRPVLTPSLWCQCRSVCGLPFESWSSHGLNFMMGIPIKPILFYGYDPRWVSWVKYDFIENANIGLILRLVDIGWKYLLMCCIWWLTISTLILLQGWAQMRPSTLEFCYNLNKMTRKWYKNSIKSGSHRGIRTTI